MQPDQRRCLVTGGSAGIGAAIVEQLLSEGAAVAVVDLEQPQPAHRSLVAYVRSDVTDSTAMGQAAQDVADQLGGPLDVVVANAGRCQSGRLATDPAERLTSHFQVNTLGVLNTFTPHIAGMRARGRGSLIAISSNCAHAPRLDLGAYCVSKAATKMLVECLALELAPDGIRVNAVAPGSCDTELQRRQWAELGVTADRQIRGDLDSFRSGIPAGRLAVPTDIARAVSFLASPAADFIRGATLVVDGAQSL
ncbi:SDR family NAD(P)-dependent oxidoreductase [Ornithinimicrobium cavernae]|uniref:SDR family NAD(P)-dependent oxidoreductase n=1 Tax=Ornithinimicrobium cavernae TaxID=2666047 RepID=UPI001379CA6A|nr:SDR family oxidoreductase [Ornithinimicrobium cavernae]